MYQSINMCTYMSLIMFEEKKKEMMINRCFWRSIWTETHGKIPNKSTVIAALKVLYEKKKNEKKFKKLQSAGVEEWAKVMDEELRAQYRILSTAEGHNGGTRWSKSILAAGDAQALGEAPTAAAETAAAAQTAAAAPAAQTAAAAPEYAYEWDAFRGEAFRQKEGERREYTSVFIMPTDPHEFIEAVWKNPETKWTVAGTTLEEYNAIKERKTNVKKTLLLPHGSATSSGRTSTRQKRLASSSSRRSRTRKLASSCSCT